MLSPPPPVMCGTLKQEVETQEGEAALFDNTKWCKVTTKPDTCRTHTLKQITQTDSGKHFQQCLIVKVFF